MANNLPDELFSRLLTQIEAQASLLQEIADKLDQLELGRGMATISDYEAGKEYKRNMLVVDPQTETVYRVMENYQRPSQTVEQDCLDGLLKLVGFESQVVAFDHNPTQNEINTLPDGVLVTIYSPTDETYYRPTQLE